MKAFRRRFVQYNMLLIGLVLLLVVVGIAVYMYWDYYEGLRTTMEQVVQPLDSFSATDLPAAPAPEDGGQSLSTPEEGQPEPPEGEWGRLEDGDREGITTVFYSPDTGSVSVLSQASALVDSETLSELLDEVISTDEEYGVLRGYSVIYYRSGNSDLYKIALTSTSYITNSMVSLLLVLALVWVSAMLCFLLISVRLSNLAVRPMEEAMQREKQFVADASHDLKTPLSVILANNSILRENPDATVGSQQRWIDSTQQAAKNMQQLIGEMLTLADVERTDAPRRVEPVDLSEVVTKAALQLESVAYEKNVALESEIPEGIVVRGSEDELQRIASSLVENALKYEPSGGVVTVTLSAAKGHVCLEVRNQGAYIAEEDLPHVFDRFYRGDKSRQDGSGGHGLGLAITKQLVERLGGELSAASSPERGTVFTVRFHG